MCRPGEILSLQWQDVDLQERQITIRAEKAKTRRQRKLPISRRLLGVLEMRRHDPEGEEFGPAAYVFGDELGQQATSVRTAWENARQTAGLGDLHLADLRHEAGSRFEEAGAPTVYVSKFPGHRNLTTTTRYLNTTIRGLRLALEKLEESRELPPLANGLQMPVDTPAQHSRETHEPASRKPLIS
jgi:integrase